MAQLLFETEFTSKMHDIDAAGVMFFARYFYYAHDTYEQFLNQQQYNIAHLIHLELHLPVIHAEADFKAPIGLNETITIQLFLREQRTHSFSLECYFYNNKNELKAVVQTVHVCINARDNNKAVLPDEFFQHINIVRDSS